MRGRFFTVDIAFMQSKEFLELSIESRALYLDILSHCDHNGVTSGLDEIIQKSRCSVEDYEILRSKGYVSDIYPDACIVNHWDLHNEEGGE